MPYALALAVWQVATLLLYLGSALADPARRRPPARALRPICLTRDRLWLLLALAFPAVFVNIGHGHNGFLTAALLGTALVALDRRPIVAGMLFGLMAYKPQFGVMIPLVLIATGRWRAFAAAAATVLALALATHGVRPRGLARVHRLDAVHPRRWCSKQGGTGWHKIQSVFSWVRMWGGGVPLAYAVQGAVTRRARGGAGLAVAQRGGLSAQGRGADDRVDPRHALQPRLRPGGAGAGDRVPCRRGARARLRARGRRPRWRCSGSCR